MTRFFRHDEVSTEDGKPVVYLNGERVELDENEITKNSVGITVTGRHFSRRIRQIRAKKKKSEGGPTARHFQFAKR